MHLFKTPLPGTCKPPILSVSVLLPAREGMGGSGERTKENKSPLSTPWTGLPHSEITHLVEYVPHSDITPYEHTNACTPFPTPTDALLLAFYSGPLHSIMRDLMENIRKAPAGMQHSRPTSTEHCSTTSC